jgi:aminoglycoside phosphotransferase (APT) family kinase protein
MVETNEPVQEPLGAVSLEDFRAWLAKGGVILAPPLRQRLISGGRSNLTYLISAADGTQVVLRRPPLDLVLATAHDMNREWRFISALQDTPVPVPEPLARDASAELLGVPFYVMSYVEGIVPHDAGRAAVLDLRSRATLATQLIDVMVDLHSVNIDEVGLADIAKREDYISRQLRRWKRQWDQSACTDIRAIHEAYHRLVAAVPEQAGTGIVHGDLRLGNVICDGGGFIKAVLDWELATLGDPLGDLSWLLSSWTEPQEVPGEVAAPALSPSVLDGFPSRDSLAARYAQRSGASLDRLPFYIAFSHWRGACISAGVYTRYMSGAMADDGFDFTQMRSSIEARAGQALELLTQL